MVSVMSRLGSHVYRRIGGLEILTNLTDRIIIVYRRIGGLEK